MFAFTPDEHYLMYSSVGYWSLGLRGILTVWIQDENVNQLHEYLANCSYKTAKKYLMDHLGEIYTYMWFGGHTGWLLSHFTSAFSDRLVAVFFMTVEKLQY